MAKATGTAKRSTAHLVGSWSFVVGVVLAVLLGLGFTGTYQVQMVWVVFLVGVVVGILNIASDEVSGFLTSGTILTLVSFLGTEAGVFAGLAPQIVSILSGILALFVPATIIVALRAVFVMARN